MTITPMKTKAEMMLAEQFVLALPGLPGNEAVKQLRKDAFASFDRQGLPGRKLEAWHYTDVRQRMQDAALPIVTVQDYEVAAAFSNVDTFASIGEPALRLVNGMMVDEEGVPGIDILPMREALMFDHPLVKRIGEAVGTTGGPVVDLNTAMFSDGVVAHIHKGFKSDRPLMANCDYGVGMPRALNARNLVIVEDDVEITIIENTYGLHDVAYQTNAVLELIIGNNSKVRYIRSVQIGRESQYLFTMPVVIGANSSFDLFTLTTGTALCRNETRVTMKGEGSRIGLRGVSLLRGEGHADNTLEVDHQAPNCESRELFRHVLDGASTATFQGKIMVKQAAQKTDGQMASNAVLLSDDATMNNKPELEIFADDVVCAHGATCGALDEDLLFYLQARGLPKKEAESLMIQAFAGEAIDAIENEDVRDALHGVVENWLKARATA